MPKMYFAELKRKEPFEKFEKFGHTSKNDVAGISAFAT